MPPHSTYATSHASSALTYDELRAQLLAIDALVSPPYARSRRAASANSGDECVYLINGALYVSPYAAQSIRRCVSPVEGPLSDFAGIPVYVTPVLSSAPPPTRLRRAWLYLVTRWHDFQRRIHDSLNRG